MNLIRFHRSPVIGSLLEDFEKNFFNNLEETRGTIPAVNIREEDDSFVMEMAAPGLKKEDFKIELDKQVLTISYEKKEEKENNDDNYTLREFAFTNFSRSFTLPESIAFDKIKADYKEGILLVKMPKKKEQTKLTREIKVS